MNFLARHAIPTLWLLARNCLHLPLELPFACRVAALSPSLQEPSAAGRWEVRGIHRTSCWGCQPPPHLKPTASHQKDLGLHEATVKAADWLLTGPWAENLWNCVDFNTLRKNTIMSNVSFLLTGAQQGTWFSHSHSRATSFWISAQTTQLHPAHHHDVLLTTWERPKSSYTLQNEPGKARTGFLRPCCPPCLPSASQFQLHHVQQVCMALDHGEFGSISISSEVLQHRLVEQSSCRCFTNWTVPALPAPWYQSKSRQNSWKKSHSSAWISYLRLVTIQTFTAPLKDKGRTHNSLLSLMFC